jgi:pimeloyl-ACP methyl ester carboxylesterase
MRRLRRFALVAAVLLAATPTLTATAPDSTGPGPGIRVKLPDGRAINFRCVGRGFPTVIFESGFGASSRAWTEVQALVAATHEACAYDRAGYGYSDPGPLPRDGAAVARDLDQALRAARVRGPYIVVGHSAGALYARLFIARRPRDVVGVVLIDPSVTHQDVRLAEAFGAGAGSLAPLRARAERCRIAAKQKRLPSTDPNLAQCTPQGRAGLTPELRAERLADELRPDTWNTQVSELDTLWNQTSDEVDARAPRRLKIPLVVLTADSDNQDAPSDRGAEALRVWTHLHQELAATSTRGRQETVAGSTHMMMFDHPAIIASTIAAMSHQAAVSRRRDQTRR